MARLKAAIARAEQDEAEAEAAAKAMAGEEEDPLPNELSDFLDELKLSDSYVEMRGIAGGASLALLKAVGEQGILERGSLPKVKVRRLWNKLDSLPPEVFAEKPPTPKKISVAAADGEKLVGEAEADIARLEEELNKRRGEVATAEEMLEQPGDDEATKKRKKRMLRVGSR